MKRVVIYFVIFSISILGHTRAQAENFQDLVNEHIAVEKIIGSTESNVFAGWVGSLILYPKKNLVIITELTSVGTRVRSGVALYEISRLSMYEDALEIELIDSEGYDWRGRIWRDDGASPLQVDLFRKDSPQRWIKFGKNGLKFLKDNNISHIILGQ